MAVIHHQGIIDGSKVAILSSSRERERKHMLYSKSRCRLKTMAGIRVRLQFPDDEKYWIYIDHTHMRTVQDVVNSINEKFSVCCEKLLLDDAQLPWMESVSLIQERDILWLVIRIYILLLHDEIMIDLFK